MSKPIWTGKKILAAGIAVAICIAALVTVVISIEEFGLVSGRGLAERIIVVGLLAFATSLLAFGTIRYEPGKFLDKDEIRSAIAIALTVLYVILLPLSLVPNVGLDFAGEFLKNFHIVYVSIIGFYFGTQAIEILRGPK
jgi:hypothetical protein